MDEKTRVKLLEIAKQLMAALSSKEADAWTLRDLVDQLEWELEE